MVWLRTQEQLHTLRNAPQLPPPLTCIASIISRDSKVSQVVSAMTCCCNYHYLCSGLDDNGSDEPLAEPRENGGVVLVKPALVERRMDAVEKPRREGGFEAAVSMQTLSGLSFVRCADTTGKGYPESRLKVG